MRSQHSRMACMCSPHLIKLTPSWHAFSLSLNGCQFVMSPCVAIKAPYHYLTQDCTFLWIPSSEMLTEQLVREKAFWVLHSCQLLYLLDIWISLLSMQMCGVTTTYYTLSMTVSHGRSLQWISHEEEPGLSPRAEHATLCRTGAPIFSPPLPRSFVILPFLCIHFYGVDHGLSPTTMCLPTHEKILWTSMCSRFLSFMHLLERELRVSLFISPELCKRHLQ